MSRPTASVTAPLCHASVFHLSLGRQDLPIATEPAAVNNQAMQRKGAPMATVNAHPSMNAPNERDPLNNNSYGTLVDREYVDVGLPIVRRPRLQ